MLRSILKYRFLFLLYWVAIPSIAQDTLELESVEITDRSFRMKKIGLYDGELQEEKNIRGFTQLEIFRGSLSDFWTSKESTCIRAKLVDNDQETLQIKWNKDQEGCDWVGFGFGWDNWVAKDIGYVLDTMAIELTVRSTGENFTNIPWAFCLEDYSGGQAWLGYNTSFLNAESISKEWTTVQIPVSQFPFEENDVDASNIKQLMTQVFAEGEIEIASIELVPFANKSKKSTAAVRQKINVDGDLSEWKNTFTPLGEHSFSVAYSEDHLYFAVKVTDKSPRKNIQTGANLWNGDAIEIAFSTNPNADKRNFLLLSDQHIGINCGDNPYVWNWKTNEALKEATYQFTTTDNGYVLELGLPINQFRKFDFQEGTTLDFEIAIDSGENSGRTKQHRWNSDNKEGFHLSPALWGELLVK